MGKWGNLGRLLVPLLTHIIYSVCVCARACACVRVCVCAPSIYLHMCGCMYACRTFCVFVHDVWQQWFRKSPDVALLWIFDREKNAIHLTSSTPQESYCTDIAEGKSLFSAKMHVANRSFAAPETRLLHNLSVLSARSDFQDFPHERGGRSWCGSGS